MRVIISEYSAHEMLVLMITLLMKSRDHDGQVSSSRAKQQFKLI